MKFYKQLMNVAASAAVSIDGGRFSAQYGSVKISN